MAKNLITVIYDGQCRLCQASLDWLQLKCEITAHSFHEINPADFQLTLEECQRQVIAISGNQIYKGAAAVAVLLKHRGNRVLALLLKASGPLGHAGYRWVADHRNSIPVRLLTSLLDRFSRFLL
jgi:predicted DCC family thiol-disulfide oxidoreductase YuxK